MPQVQQFFLEGMRPEMGHVGNLARTMAQPPQMQRTFTIRNDVNLKKNTLKLVRDETNATQYFFGAMLAARDGMFLRDLLAELGLLQAGPTVLYLDSKSAIDLAFDPVAFRRTKHIMRSTFFLRDLVARRFFAPRHIAGTSNPADVFPRRWAARSSWRCSACCASRLAREPR